VVSVVVLGAAYAGTYQLLTATAARDRARILRDHGPQVAAYPEPGAAPSLDDRVAYDAWSARNERYRTRLEYERVERVIDGAFLATAAAFGLQAAVTAALVLKMRRKRLRASA